MLGFLDLTCLPWGCVLLRLLNPGSDIDSFVRIFSTLFDSLRDFTAFAFDDISAVLVEKNLATSSGYMCEEALRRSRRARRGLDTLFNQSKSYSELFRLLGGIHPLPHSSSTFRPLSCIAAETPTTGCKIHGWLGKLNDDHEGHINLSGPSYEELSPSV